MKLIYTSYDPSLKNILQNKLTSLNESGYEITKFSHLSICKQKEDIKYAHVAIFSSKEKYKRLRQIERGEWVSNLRELGYQYVGNTGSTFVFNSLSKKEIVQDDENIDEFFKVKRFFTLTMKFALALFVGYYFINDFFTFDSLLDYSNNSRIFSTILPSLVAILFGTNALMCLATTTSYVRKTKLKPNLPTIYTIKALLTISSIVCVFSFFFDVVEYNINYTNELSIITLEDFGYLSDSDSSTYHQASSFLLNDSYQSLQVTSDFSYSDYTLTGDLLSIMYFEGYNSTLVDTYFTIFTNDLSSKNVVSIEQYNDSIYYCTNESGMIDLVIVYSDDYYIEIASSFDLYEYILIIEDTYLH